MSVDLPEPLDPMMPMLSFSYAVKLTPLSACTSLVERRLRCRTPCAVSADVARLPVASTWYVTWTSSAMTTGRRVSVTGPATGSVDAAIALLGGPEEHDAHEHEDHGPRAGDRPQFGTDLVDGMPVEQQRPGERQEGVDRLEVEDPQRLGMVREPDLGGEEDAG